MWVGDIAPDFTLPSQSGEMVRLSDRLRGGVVVLYFYPKDNTPGCTAEACGFADSYRSFIDAGADVIGVSSDPVRSHAAFATRHQLPFTLLSDVRGRVRARYGVPKAFAFLPGRVTYVIDQAGLIRYAFSSLTKVDRHVTDALTVVRQLRSYQSPPPEPQPQQRPGGWPPLRPHPPGAPDTGGSTGYSY